MIESSSCERLQALYGLFEPIGNPECQGCSDCCHHAWLLIDELPAFSPERATDPPIQRFGGTPFIAGHETCGFASQGRCTCYARRPLDCRIFPLDLIEESGRLCWCIMESCPHHRAIGDRLEPLIPLIERLLTPALLHEYIQEIRVCLEIYAPYAEGRYRKIRPLEISFEPQASSCLS